MGGNGPTPLATLLGSGRVGRLGAEARERSRFTERIRGRLPADAAAHLLTAGLDAAGRLVLGMDSAAWASQVRYLVPELDGHPVTVRVVPPRGS